MGGIVAMSSTINASTASGGGVVTTADASGILQLQTAGTTALTIDASQNVTLAKGLTLGASAAPAFSAYASVAQSLVSGATTKIALNTEVFDTNSNFDSTTNYRFTPTVAGYYFVSGVVFAANNVTNVGVYALILKNGICVAAASSTANPSMYSGATVTSVIYFNGSTDYIELFGASAGGTYNTAVGVYATGDGCRLSAFLARSA